MTAQTDLLDCIELETAPNPTHAVIWLHGLGADGNDFVPIVPELRLDGLAVRFVFPNAPCSRSPSTAAWRCARGTTSW